VLDKSKASARPVALIVGSSISASKTKSLRIPIRRLKKMGNRGLATKLT
jgi:hypothetical protein